MQERTNKQMKTTAHQLSKPPPQPIFRAVKEQDTAMEQETVAQKKAKNPHTDLSNF